MALAHGHPPERVERMALHDLEALTALSLAPDLVRLVGDPDGGN